MRERGIQYEHLQASSITELEVFAKWPGLSMPYEVEMLEREGFVRDGQITAKGRAFLDALPKPEKKPSR